MNPPYKSLLEDDQINTVFITTRHDLHARMIIEALKAGKNVHVEKPLCLNKQELAEIESVYRDCKSQHLFVGFNRRFSPHAEKIKALVSSRTAPLCMNWTINAGHIPADVWIQDPQVGGGRIIGEGCHWIDFMSYLAGSSVSSVSAVMVGKDTSEQVKTDKMIITVSFSNGSIGVLQYLANGSKSYPKETFQLFCQGKVLKLDNFRN